MATPQIIVSRQVHVRLQTGQELARAARDQDVEIALDEERHVRLLAGGEKSAAYAQILAGLETLKQPVYLEVDPDTDAIILLRVPDVGRVRATRETQDGLEFELDSSHARFLLRKTDDRFRQVSDMLLEAHRSGRPLILTTDDRGEVIDARFFDFGPDDGPPLDFPFPFPRPAFDWRWLLRWWIWPWNWWPRGCISAQRAQTVFNQMSATSCAPLTVPAPCIPFLYPDDGCWARAHEMARLMIAMGLSPRKVWIQGWLHTPTRNNPNCFVNWGWHVAPTLCVRTRWWWLLLFWGGQKMVIDPSLFTTPVTVSQWKSVQGDPSATLTYTDASDYLWGQTDPGYVLTNNRLAYYRIQLQTRAVNSGPPPYANCP